MATPYLIPVSRRREGLKCLGTTYGDSRVVGFVTRDGVESVSWFTDLELKVYQGDACVATISTPWAESQLAQVKFMSHVNTLHILHSDVGAQVLTFTNNEGWVIEPLQMEKSKC